MYTRQLGQFRTVQRKDGSDRGKTKMLHMVENKRDTEEDKGDITESRSRHTKLVNSQLHSATQLISGCLHPIQTQWLPGLANIRPLDLHQQSAVDKMLS